jgi:hypothetical protein
MADADRDTVSLLRSSLDVVFKSIPVKSNTKSFTPSVPRDERSIYYNTVHIPGKKTNNNNNKTTKKHASTVTLHPQYVKISTTCNAHFTQAFPLNYANDSAWAKQMVKFVTYLPVKLARSLSLAPIQNQRQCSAWLMHGVCLLSMKGVQREGQSVNVLGWVLVSS